MDGSNADTGPGQLFSITDTSGYNASEVVWRLNRHHHAGLIVCADSAERVETLVHEYSNRFFEEFCAIVPAPDKPTT